MKFLLVRLVSSEYVFLSRLGCILLWTVRKVSCLWWVSSKQFKKGKLTAISFRVSGLLLNVNWMTNELSWNYQWQSVLPCHAMLVVIEFGNGFKMAAVSCDPISARWC